MALEIKYSHLVGYLRNYKMNSKKIVLVTGGDQNNETIPERAVCDQMNVALIDGLGDKIQSSSWLLKKL